MEGMRGYFRVRAEFSKESVQTASIGSITISKVGNEAHVRRENIIANRNIFTVQLLRTIL